MRVRLATLCVALPFLLSARPAVHLSAEPLVDWIVELQVTGGEGHGAVAMHRDPSFRLDGQAYRHVVPYFSNLAVSALLDASPADASLRVAERWINWFLDHVGPDGVPVEHWISQADGSELTCPSELATTPVIERCEAIDATDSGAATFLIALEDYLDAGGLLAFLRQREAAIRDLARTLLDLQDDDGLTIARTDYPVKYLMDNAETVAGFWAMARLEREVFGGDSDMYMLAADRASSGLATLLDPDTGLHAWAKMPDGHLEASRLDRWYADAVAQVWPLVFDVQSAPTGYRQLDEAWDGTRFPDWTRHRDASGFSWPVLGVAALRAGDLAAARQQAEALVQRHVATAGGGPFTVADAGWLLRTVAALEER